MSIDLTGVVEQLIHHSQNIETLSSLSAIYFCYKEVSAVHVGNYREVISAMKTTFIILSCLSLVSLNHAILPSDLACDPLSGTCRKGDFVAQSIADCKYDRSLLHPISCDAQNDDLIDWTVDVARGNRCKPVYNRHIICGSRGSNTRCVCSDVNPFESFNINLAGRRIEYDPKFNECRCQYWPQGGRDEL